MDMQNDARTLEICEVGPIKAVKFDINKINLFIGPQGSGKSTIAKIISFCFWLEKNAVLHQGVDHINNEFFNENLLIFHKLDKYFSQKSCIRFSGDVISFEYKGKDLISVERGVAFESARVSKIAYIPAERVIVTIPEIASVPFPNNCLRNYIFEWFNVRNKYSLQNKCEIADLGVSYYFNEESKKDILILQNKKEIELHEASSGMQAAVPLYILIDYLSNWIYANVEDVSFEKKDLVISAMSKMFDQYINESHKNISKINKNEEFESRKNDLMKQLLDLSIEIQSDKSIKEDFFKDPKTGRYYSLSERLSFSHFSNIIVEEPELNLFPETQSLLVYSILKSIKQDRDNVVITTHSPYILYALNNCMQAWIANKNDSESMNCLIGELSFDKDSFVNPQKVSVWELENGIFKKYNGYFKDTIQDEDGLIRKNYFDTIMQNVINDFSMLNSIS